MGSPWRPKTARTTYAVCRGELYVNDDAVFVNHRVLKIALVAAGLDAETACGPIRPDVAERILHMERSYQLAALTDEIRRNGPGRAA